MKGFKAFLLRGNVVDLAVGVVIGIAFGAVVTAFVKDLVTPLIAAIGGKPDFSTLYFTVNNSKFLSYLEEARLRWMMTLPGEWIDENVAPVVAAAHLNYRRPIEWPNEIVVELGIFLQGLIG